MNPVQRRAAMAVLAMLSAGTMLLQATPAISAAPDEFAIKRQETFEFTEPPAVSRDGDKVTIRFASKAYCDATVAIEDGRGRIIRHLASGVLGANAPEPFQKDSLVQTLVWDSKDDRGIYVKNREQLLVRVSLGLRPRFERTLYWSPHKRISNIAPLMVARPEGVYVFEGLGVDHLRLFDHDANYLRTIYPFRGDKIDQVVGLPTQVYPQDGRKLPLKVGYEQATLLTSGSSAAGAGDHAGGFGATAMAVAGDRIALAERKLNRLATDGTSGGLPAEGPEVGFAVRVGNMPQAVGPTSMALSPDGKRLYMTGFVWKTHTHMDRANAFHLVKFMDFDSQEPPKVFVGVPKADGGLGESNDRLCVPTDVQCDSQGRVYVADYGNNRIQIFSGDGTYLKTIATPTPAAVRIDPKTGEIWAFSWPAIGPSTEVYRLRDIDYGRIKPTLRRLGTFDKPQAGPPQELPLVVGSGSGGWIATGGQVYQVAVDFYHPDRPTIWLVGRRPTISLEEANWMSGSGLNNMLGGWAGRGIKVIAQQGDKWEIVADFAERVSEKVTRLTPPSFSRQRLYVNPADGKLYVCEEQTGPGKSFYSMLQINPDDGRIREIKLPFDTEDIAFDIDGLIYLCTDREIVRYDPITWREVPWDYGEERQSIGFCSSANTRTNAQAALPIPGTRPVWWHSTGMWVNPRGELALTCNIPQKDDQKKAKERYITAGIGRPFKPIEYPGRSGSRVIQVFDRHGQLIHSDAVPGLTNGDGLGIDNQGHLYVMVAAQRIIDGKPYFDEKSETLMKFRPGKVKLLSAGRAPIVLGEDNRPTRSPDFTKYGMGATWAEGADWAYGGVGYGGQGGSCVCWHARFQLDYFARSFAPEVRRFNVAVLDSNGNLILRIGRYGNVDEGKPLADDDAGPAQPRSIGGDEVSLFHGAYVGVHTDHRLYIHDAGNARILSVKLDYHATQRISLP